MKFKKWNIGTPAADDVALLREAGYPYLLSTVLAARGITSAEAAADFLDRERKLITSTVLLRDYLRSCGARCLRYIPRRIEDGYGLSRDAIRQLRDQGATLMITVDSGITGNDEVAYRAWWASWPPESARNTPVPAS